MSQTYVLTDENKRELRNAISHRRLIPIEVYAYEKPMIELLQGLSQADRDLQMAIEEIESLKVRIEESHRRVTHLALVKSNYENVLGASFNKTTVESFIGRVNKEWDRINSPDTVQEDEVAGQEGK